MYQEEPVSRHAGLSQWETTVSTHLPSLSRSQATVLALWSYGMVLARSCGITSVAALLAPLLGAKETTGRQRLREWCYDAEHKRGKHRQQLDVSTCFAPLLRWVLAWWPASEQRLALAMDASTLAQRFTVLTLSVVYRGCAIPVAWVVIPACTKGAWRAHWERLFDLLAGSVPADWTVVVLADRGLYARWLYLHICKRGWHPFLRINLGGNVRPEGAATFRPLAALVPRVGSTWGGRVTCFSGKESQLGCTLLARWDAGYAAPWLIVTDLAPEVAEAAWYGMRSWIEGGVKDIKRGGWQWHQTKMTDPARDALVVGDRGGDVVGGERRRRGGCEPASERLGGVASAARGAATGDTAGAGAAAELFPAGRAGDPGGAAEGRGRAAGEVRAGGVAERAGGAQAATETSHVASAFRPFPDLPVKGAGEGSLRE